MKTKKQIASRMLTKQERITKTPVFLSEAWMKRRFQKNPPVETLHIFQNERVAESKPKDRSGIKKFPNHKW